MSSASGSVPAAYGSVSVLSGTRSRETTDIEASFWDHATILERPKTWWGKCSMEM